MKRLFLALMLLAFCFSTAVFGFFSLKKSCLELKNTLESAAAYIENDNKSAALRALESTGEKWKKQRLVFNIFLDHTTLDTLDSSLPSLSEIFKNGNSEPAFEEIQKNIAVLEDIVEEQRISIGNIL